MISRQRFEVGVTEGTTTYYLDLAQTLSLQERRLHRQHRIYTVLGGLLSDSNNDASITINTAPNNWVTRTAVKRGFRMWQKMVKQHTQEAGVRLAQLEGKWADWKIYLDATHQGASNILPLDGSTPGVDISPPGEWSYSRYVSEDVNWLALPAASADRNADEFYGHIVGDHSGTATNWISVGLIQSWLKSRPQVAALPIISPNDGIGDDPLTAIFDETDAQDEVLENLADDNELPPYDQNEVFGGYVAGAGSQLQRQAMAHTSAQNPIVPFNGFEAIHGLVQINVTGTSTGLATLLIDVDTQGVSL